MALVDYSSSDSASESEETTGRHPPPSKRQRTGREKTTGSVGRAAPDLPPSPAAFHDLYAHTVRASTADDPSLHQGRARQIPHVAGNWPSHLYVEWHPSSGEHSALASLLSALADELDGAAELNTLLTSDLGVPLPLHVSLSRPFVLSTAEKDGFHEQLVQTVGAGGVVPFHLRFADLFWHRSPDSNRSFLVLRVSSKNARSDEEDQGGAGGGGDDNGDANPNPELTRLLQGCNALVSSYGQPKLYRLEPLPAGEDRVLNGSEEVLMGMAFHVSIAWSFAELTDEIQTLTAAVWNRPSLRKHVDGTMLRVDAVKAKIGNAVTSLNLVERGKGGKSLGR